MAIPFTPIAVAALKYGGAALAAYAVARAMPQGRRDQRFEDALDELPEGLSAHTSHECDGRGTRRTQMGGRLRRVVRWPGNMRGLEIDLGAIARLRIRRVA